MSFPLSRFQTFGSLARHTWSSIPTGESRTLQLVVAPLRAGELIVSPASVSYEHSGQKHITKLASDDSLIVEGLFSYKRRTDKHALEWALYGIAFILLSAAPYFSSIMLEKSVPQTSGKKKN